MRNGGFCLKTTTPRHALCSRGQTVRVFLCFFFWDGVQQFVLSIKPPRSCALVCVCTGPSRLLRGQCAAILVAATSLRRCSIRQLRCSIATAHAHTHTAEKEPRAATDSKNRGASALLSGKQLLKQQHNLHTHRHTTQSRTRNAAMHVGWLVVVFGAVSGVSCSDRLQANK